MKDKQPAVKKGSLPVILIISLVIVMFTGVLVYAAYSQRGVVKEEYLGANREFHFHSDLLASDGTIPEYYVSREWDDFMAGETLFIFELHNYKDSLNISSIPINYTIKYEIYNYDTFGGEGLVATVTENGTLSAGGGARKNIVEYKHGKYWDNITPPLWYSYFSNNTELSTVNIEVTSNSPYLKTLRAKLNITQVPMLFISEMADNTGKPVAVLHMKLQEDEDLERDVTITWNSGAEPDMTNKIVVEAVSVGNFTESIGGLPGQMTVKLNTAATYDLVFYKDVGTIDDNYSGVSSYLD